MTDRIVARWQGWSGEGIEHLVLKEGPEEVIVDAAVLGTTGDKCLRGSLPDRLRQLMACKKGRDRPDRL